MSLCCNLRRMLPAVINFLTGICCYCKNRFLYGIVCRLYGHIIIPVLCIIGYGHRIRINSRCIALFHRCNCCESKIITCCHFTGNNVVMQLCHSLIIYALCIPCRNGNGLWLNTEFLHYSTAVIAVFCCCYDSRCHILSGIDIILTAYCIITCCQKSAVFSGNLWHLCCAIVNQFTGSQCEHILCQLLLSYC